MNSIRPLAAAAMLTLAVAAQSFSYPNFAGATGLVLHNSATVASGNGTLQLTPMITWNAGQAYAALPLSVMAGFDTTFTFRVTVPASGGADGMAFIIHNAVAGTAAIPLGGNNGQGSDNGYAANAGVGIDNALVVEIDLWQMAAPWGDSSANEISVHTSGPNPASAYESTSLGRVTPSVVMNDGQVHTMRVHYVPGTLSIYLDNPTTPVLTVPYDFTLGGVWVDSQTPVAGLNLPNGTAFAGFTGATGGAPEIHAITSWTWASTTTLPTCQTGTVGTALGGAPIPVLTVNGTPGGAGYAVNTSLFSPLSIGFAPPSNLTTAPFVVWGFMGPLSAATPFPTLWGDLCFVPHALDIANPANFTLTDNVGLGIPALLPSAPGPWAFSLPTGLAFPATLTFQGALLDQGTPAITNAVTLIVNPAPAPTITAAAPGFGAPGTSVTITGTNFLPGAVVSFGGTPASVVSTTTTSIVAVVPPGTTCPGTIVVTNPDAQFASRNFNATPTVSGTLFGSGPVAGNANFYILGTNFVVGSSVTIGGAPATVLSTTGSQIICRTPPGTVGIAPVVVTLPMGCTTTTTYTYY
ncbi:MAG: hypothetical protein RIS21_1357 [Planctomycetota bacterium]